MTPNKRALVLSVLLAALLALAGCGGSGTSPGASGVEKKDDGSVVIKAPTGDVTAKVDPGSGGVTVKTDDGEVTAGTGLPNGFPKGEIPIIDGAVVGGSKGQAGGPYAYTVLLQVDGSSPAAVVEKVTAQLEGAGFTAVPGMSMDQMSTATFTGATYEVGVNAVEGAGKVTVTYVVKKK